ncbi:MAG: ADP-glyceromanno-heptose 6-epimerase [Deltaproteobacteria bacterium]|nr:ADP-glyceromanno-heptose 6-epimerase [Deltaproteobacteria bacterium]
MNVLITGGAGFIGSQLALRLQDLAQVCVVDNFASANPDNLKGFKGEVIKLDVSEEEININKRIDVVFHEASNTDTTFKDDREMLRNNIEGFKKILIFCKENKAKLIYASSAGVYGKGEVPMKEEQKAKPLNAYAFSKYMMDLIALREIEKGADIIGLRYFNVYGPHEEHKNKASSMILQLARQIKEGKNPKLFKYGEQFRDFIYVFDVVEANIAAMKSNARGIFNVGTGKKTTFNEIVEILNRFLHGNKKTVYIDNPYERFYQCKTLADMEKTRRELNFSARYDIVRGIKDYLEKIGFIDERKD